MVMNAKGKLPNRAATKSRGAGSKPIGSRPIGSRPIGSKPLGSKPLGSKPIGSKPSPTRKATAQKATAQKASASKLTPEQKQRKQALDTALGNIEKQYGKGSIMTLGQNQAVRVPGISTGSLSLDLALGGNGVPRGRITEVYGPESSGKTTFCSHVIANAQKLGGVCAFIDAEHAFDAAYARNLGVNLDELLVSQPDTGEQALEIAEALIRSNAVDVVVVDSVAALVPKAEIEGEMGASHVGLQARLMSQALRKLSGAIRTSNTSMIFTNQIRMKIGVMFGSPETTSGGNALKFYASVRVDMRRIGSIKGPGDVMIGNHTRVKIVKNKIAPPFRIAEFDIMFGKGIDYVGDLLELSVNSGVATKSGSWYSWGETRLGQGKEKSAEFLRANGDILSKLELETKAALGLIEGETSSGAPPTASSGEASDRA